MKAPVGTAIALILGAASLAFASKPARADMHLCNQTSYVLYTAIGFQDGSSISTHGWTRIAPGDCALTIREALTRPLYYIYAKTSQAHSGPARAWGGSAKLCAKNTNFSLQTPLGAPGCGSDDTFPVPFATVYTHGMASWTTTFTENPVINSFYAAQKAGFARLLGDIGNKVSLGDGAAHEDLLAKLRIQLKLAANASPDELFDALETQAFKAAAPAGYSICNDGDAIVWAALGTQTGNDFVSRGWWKVSPGGCAKLIAEPLAADRIFVFAEKHGNNRFVSGPAKFCITDIEFEIRGNQRCAARGLAEAGFAVTNTKGMSGYTAHVGASGLVPPARQVSQARTPK